ncbi:PREDICTED: ubiquitin carboxyl-terminal hydrolase 21-like [Camelina sativa]|uniref:Ubiquitin carboxyl-terminal hydrolase 21-like n=1 Tax=Camelina sativa TaxID=90675 RepID=A0ABM1R302_CAMSA|nr:PREDICTED: ubiquitin carboxyl-terminal hydrolase 21-like [Camelina sativa]
MQALQDHIKLALKSSGSYITTNQFRDNLNHFSPDFQINNQEDAYEFLQSFLDKLERCLIPRNNSPGSVSSQDVNIVDHVFGGRLMSRLHCRNCNSFSDTLETSLGWSLEIEDVDNLSNALESFTRVEQLEDQLTCDNSKEKVSKEKQFQLDKLPLVATFHLKRFKNDGLMMKKISKHVEFPLELDLLPYMSGNQDSQVSTKYHLYAIVEHLGYRASFGHYSSYVRSAPETWHKFDDAKVTRISEDDALSTNAYILFFVREGTPTFSSAFEVSKPWYEASPLYSSPRSVLESSWREEYAFDHDNENGDNLKLSTMPVLGTSWTEKSAFGHDYENSDNFTFSTKPVLETSWRDKCVSDHSYENVSTSNKACNYPVGVSILDINNLDLRCYESQEQVFHSADSDSNSYMSDNFESPKADKTFAETSSEQEEPNLSPERKGTISLALIALVLITVNLWRILRKIMYPQLRLSLYH